MNDQTRTNHELLEENALLKQRIQELELSDLEYKQPERLQCLAAEILGILNDSADFDDTVKCILTLIKRETGFAAVGIRLRSGDDFPYFVQNGFSQDFLLTENTLIARNAIGGPCRDENGNISLECTCGLIISGQTDPTNPLFTKGGSAWTNNSLPFLDLPAEQDPRLHPRNKCIHQGYLSVALIPVRVKREIIGLLQFNDRRKDCFTLDVIHFFEGIAASIGVALMRKQAEEALRERDIQLKKLTSWVPGMIYQFTKRPDGTYCVPFTTEAIKDIFGCSPQDVREDFSPIARIILPEDFDKVVGSIEYSAKHLTIWACEYRVQIPGQSIRWLWGNSTPEKLADGSITWYGFNTDITERKRAEETLRGAEQNFRRSLDDSPLGVRIVTAEGETIYANRAILDIYGYDSVDEIRATPVKKRYTPESYAEFQIRREKRKRGDYGPSEYEISIVRKDGAVRHLQVFRKDVLWDGEKQFQVIYQDITARKRVEETLRLITDSMSDMIRVTDLQGVNLYVSPSHAKVLGYKPEERLGKTGLDIAHPDDVEHIINVISEGLVNKKPAKVEYRIKHADGHYVWLETIGDPIRNDQGEVTAAIQSSRDITDRKQAEEALRESEKRFKNLYQESPIPTFTWQKKEDDFTLVDFNRAALQITNGKVVDQLGNSALKLYINNPKVLSDMNLCYKEQSVVRREIVSQHFAPGRIFSVHYAFIPPDLIIVHTEDQTERKQAEEKLQASKVQLSNALEIAHLGHWEYDVANDLFTFNDHFYKIFHTTVDKVGGYTMHSAEYAHRFVHPDDMDVVGEETRKAIETTDPHFNRQIEHRMLYADGTVGYITVRFFIVKDSHGRTVKTYGVNQDITERKRAEEALQESEARYRSMFETSQDNIFIVDQKTGNFIAANDAACHLYGYTKDEFLRMKHSDVSAESEKTKAAVRDSITRVPLRLHRKKDGTVFPVEIAGGYFMQGGRALHTAFIRDITERKQAEEERRSLEERLNRAEKMEALGLLAGGVAHDLNNVLGIVVGYAEMLLMAADTSSPMRPSLVNIMNGGQRAAAIVEDLLTLARRGVSDRDVLNLNKIIADCQQSPEFEKLYSYHPSVKIKTDLEPDLSNISGSSVHLDKTIFNLVSNACEAMAKGGIVTIKTTNQYLDKPIQGYDQIRVGDYVVLSVSDTGEGIPAADLKRIFEPFYTKKVMGRSGTGLGLSVVWGTAKDHHGYINVESEEGKGSAFTLYFPMTRGDITAEAVAVAISEYMGKGESILVVDDVKEQRDLAAGMLGTLNYNVSSVSSGEEAVAYLKEHEVDLMVLDMIMDPGMDGLDTYKQVLEIHPQQKAIIVSGFSETERVKTAKALGAGAYVRKPYIKEKLGLAVRNELDRSA